ncbi:hypothetical protein AB0J82_12625 [Asanoa sp. NPDC049518]|uniref:hypothetical protein n=1 Tax=unclassified Asanoa TaxID=2685164 RepID=UPI00342E3112
MTIHVVDVHQRTHQCPASPDAHVYDTQRTLIAVIDGGPCRAPVTIRCGTTIATVPCGRARPADARCGACRVIVTERTIATHQVAA